MVKNIERNSISRTEFEWIPYVPPSPPAQVQEGSNTTPHHANPLELRPSRTQSGAISMRGRNAAIPGLPSRASDPTMAPDLQGSLRAGQRRPAGHDFESSTPQRRRFGDTASYATDSAIAPAPAPRVRTAQEDFASVDHADMFAHLHQLDALRERMERNRLPIVRNRGENNLCSIMALLHHAGLEGAASVDEAVRLRDHFRHADDALGRAMQQGEGIYADREVLQPLMAHIFGADSRQLVILRAQPGAAVILVEPFRAHDAPAFGAADVRDDAVVLLEGPGHFEAVRNNASQPWSAVLSQLTFAMPTVSHLSQTFTMASLSPPVISRRPPGLEAAIDRLNSEGVLAAAATRAALNFALRLTLEPSVRYVKEPLEVPEHQALMASLASTMIHQYCTQFHLFLNYLERRNINWSSLVSPGERRPRRLEEVVQKSLGNEGLTNTLLNALTNGLQFEFGQPHNNLSRPVWPDHLTFLSQLPTTEISTTDRHYISKFLVHLESQNISWDSIAPRVVEKRPEILESIIHDSILNHNCTSAIGPLNRALGLEMKRPKRMIWKPKLEEHIALLKRLSGKIPIHQITAIAKFLVYMENKNLSWNSVKPEPNEMRPMRLEALVNASVPSGGNLRPAMNAAFGLMLLGRSGVIKTGAPIHPAHEMLMNHLPSTLSENYRSSINRFLCALELRGLSWPELTARDSSAAVTRP